MDPWEIFCEACKIVVEEQNVYLEVIVGEDLFMMQLKPLHDLLDLEDDEDE